MNPDNNKVIEVEHLKKSFGSSIVLSDVNLYLQKDENLVIMGRSGSGKSVLIKCIVGLELPDSGSIHVFGVNIEYLGEVRLNEMRKRIGYLFQGAALYDSMTINENILFPLTHNYPDINSKEAQDMVDEVLESVGLVNVREMMPSELSGGMKKRAGLARTLILKPEIILYDEPTTGLDPYTAEEISELIVSIRDLYKTSAIIVTHDMNCSKIASDRVMVMDKGIFIAEGSFENLKKYNKLDDVKKYFS